jgi:hypothetical protein
MMMTPAPGGSDAKLRRRTEVFKAARDELIRQAAQGEVLHKRRYQHARAAPGSSHPMSAPRLADHGGDAKAMQPTFQTRAAIPTSCFVSFPPRELFCRLGNI